MTPRRQGCLCKQDKLWSAVASFESTNDNKGELGVNELEVDDSLFFHWLVQDQEARNSHDWSKESVMN